MNKDDYQKEYTTSQREVVPGNQKTSTWIEKEKKRRKDTVTENVQKQIQSYEFYVIVARILDGVL